jgi:hypothetical protein
MNTLVKLSLVVWYCGMAACVYKVQGGPSPQPVTLHWEAVDMSGDGKKPSKPVTYNIYAIPGAGPIPTEVSRTCGATEVAKGGPLNSEPIAATTYSASVAEGLRTFAVEAVSPEGCRSALSAPVTVTVPVGMNTSTGVTVGP